MTPCGYTIRGAVCAFAATAAVLSAGCIPSEPMAPGAMDELWKPDASLWAEAEPDPISFGEGESLHRVEVAYEPSVVWSVIGLNRVAREGPDADGVLRLPVSEQHARATARLLEDLAGKVRAVAAAAETADRNPGGWAESVAELVGFVHGMTASLDPDIEARRRVQVDDTAAWVVLPLLEMLLSEAGAAEAPAGEQARDLRQIETSVARVAMTISLRLTGRPMTEDILQKVLSVQRSQPAEQAVRETRNVLGQYLARTPRRYPPLRDTADKAAGAAGRLAEGMRYLAALSNQWPKVNYLAVELRRLREGRVVALEFDVREGRTVELHDLHFAAPKVTFTGHGRVVVQSDPTGGSAVTAVFESDQEAGMVLEFEGIVYALVRLLAFPLTDAHLRQIRHSEIQDAQSHTSGHVVEVFMEATRPQAEPRRLIRVRTTSTPRFEPRPELPPRLAGRAGTIELNFYDGQRRWFYTHKSFKRPELWKPGRLPPTAPARPGLD